MAGRKRKFPRDFELPPLWEGDSSDFEEFDPEPRGPPQVQRHRERHGDQSERSLQMEPNFSEANRVADVHEDREEGEPFDGEAAVSDSEEVPVAVEEEQGVPEAAAEAVEEEEQGLPEAQAESVEQEQGVPEAAAEAVEEEQGLPEPAAEAVEEEQLVPEAAPEAVNEEQRVPEAEEEQEDEDDELNSTKLVNELAEKWLVNEITHKVSKTASNQFWQLAMESIPAISRKRQGEGLTKKVNGFIAKRRKLVSENSPEILMDIGYINKSNGQLEIVRDVKTTPVAKYPPSLYRKAYEIARVKV